MGWSCGMNGRWKTGIESRYPESAWEIVAKKTEKCGEVCINVT